MQNIHDNWKPFLDDEQVINELDKIKERLKDEHYFPVADKVLRFFELDPKSIQFVIVGMEPYPTDYEKDGTLYPIATGRSFEVDNVTDWNQKFKQSSLRNILKAIHFECTGKEESLSTIRKEISDETFKISQPKEWFDKMEKQGVLFLNASLTVRKYNVGSHTDIWETFINDLIVFLRDISNPKWLLFGNDAKRRVLPHINETSAICTCHPRLNEFIKERPFKLMAKDIKINC